MKTIKFLINDPREVFLEDFSSDTWKSVYGNIHSKEDMTEESFIDWKRKMYTQSILINGKECNNNLIHFPSNEDRNKLSIWKITSGEDNHCVFLHCTLNNAIEYLIRDKRFNTGWSESNMGYIDEIIISDHNYPMASTH